MRIALSALVALLGAIGCTPATGTAPERASRQTASEVAQTLDTLRRVDDLPLYAMTYVGDYDALAGVAGPASASPFGCSLFIASGDRQRPLFARNFDWEPNPALVLHAAPPDGHASISIVDISYLGVAPDEALIADRSARRKLLNAPLLPFDGMNAKGLVVGLVADESGRADVDPAKPTVGSVRIMRLMLDRAATVDEALAVIGRYNLDFDGGPPLHYLIADAGGASAVVEFVDGRPVVTRGAPPWQALYTLHAAADVPAMLRQHAGPQSGIGI